MDKLSYLKKSIQYIESNLSQKISPDDICQIGFVSLMQLYRDFYAYTGHSVKEYIRKRRLSNALAMVKFSDIPLVDIAYTSGYSSQQAFCKYVKNTIGQTPLEYKKSDNYFYFPPFKGDMKTYISVASEIIPETITCKFYDNLDKGIENRAVNHLLTILPHFNGRLFGRNGKQSGGKFCYELYIASEYTLKKLLISSQFQDIDTYHFPSNTYATTTVKNKEDDINRMWDYLYTDWLQSSMFELDDRLYFEEYMIKKNHVTKLKLFLPVKKKNNYCKIKVKNCKTMTFLVSQKNGENAEEDASKTVINFIESSYPHLLKSTSAFIVSKRTDSYVCGIQLKKAFNPPINSDLELLTLSNGEYAILEGDCCCDGGVYEKRLVSWVEDNGFIRDSTSVFTIYETHEGFESDIIHTKVYCKLKNVKKG